MIKIFPNIDSLNQFAAEKFIEIAAEAIDKHDRFIVALAGGSTPKSLYRLLTIEKFRSRIDWSKVFFFFGDERNVLPDNPESNFRMAFENLFSNLRSPFDNIFSWNTKFEDAEKTAADYERKIRDFFNLNESEFRVLI